MLTIRYYEKVREVLDRVLATQQESIRAASGAIAEGLLSGKTWYLYGTGKHSTMIVEEAFFRAGGLMLAHPIFEPYGVLPRGRLAGNPVEPLVGYPRAVLSTYDVVPGDVLTVVSNSGVHPLSVEMALTAKQRGVTVIALTAVAYSRTLEPRYPTGQRLYEIADVVLDNCGVPGDAILTIPGLPVPVGPTSTIAGAAIINAVTIEVIERFLERGVTPPVFMSLNYAGASEWNRRYIAAYGDRIRYL